MMFAPDRLRILSSVRATEYYSFPTGPLRGSDRHERLDPARGGAGGSGRSAGGRARDLAGTAAALLRRRSCRSRAGCCSGKLISRVFIANPLFLAAPSQIVQAIFSLTLSGEMQRHMAISGIEFALGYVIASVIGIVLGFAMANSATGQARLAAVDFRPLRHADHRARAACSSCGSASASGRKCWW